jgi:drug/metabolite transporter (DMT)-like permease
VGNCQLASILTPEGQSEFTQIRFSGLEFTSYYTLSWFSYIWLTTVLPVFLLVDFAFRVFCGHIQLSPSQYLTFLYSKLAYGILAVLSHSLSENPSYSLRNYFVASLYLAPLNFFGLYLFFIPLAMIPVALNTALYQSVIIFIFILSVVWLNEEVNIKKVSFVLSTSRIGCSYSLMYQWRNCGHCSDLGVS